MPSRLMQDRLEDSPPRRRQRAAVPPLCNAHLGSSSPTTAPRRGMRKLAPIPQVQQDAAHADTRLLSADRAAQPPPLTPSTQHSDAHHTPGTDNLTLAAVIQSPADPLCLLSQDAIASSRPRRSIKRPERLRDSPTRGRNVSRPLQQETSPRPKRARHAPSRCSPSPQPTKRPRPAPTQSQHASALNADARLFPASLLSAAQQSGLPFDRGKT